MFVWSKLSSAKWEDAWEERFHAATNTALVINRLPGGQRIRVEVYCHRRENADAMQRMFGGSIRELKQQNWAALSARSLKPLHVRGRLIITHTDAAAARERRLHPDRIVLCIPGELAFGTGEHATTASCLRLLVDFSAKTTGSWEVLDLGCGTGILALAARALGASRVDACDFDPAAVRVAKKNAAANGIQKVRIFRQDVTRWTPQRQYDIVLANIFHDVLTFSFPAITAAVKPGGRVVVSGILKEQAESVLAAGRAAGVGFDAPLQRGKWVTLTGIRPA
ncbi:MAG: 50S ribosomal protein L11 methyltransferase [Verrucomicrobiales bacterium]|nr:50S ribosomal protein L11 methyltransferase [Verrucomicrobiales bacterium]